MQELTLRQVYAAVKIFLVPGLLCSTTSKTLRPFSLPGIGVSPWPHLAAKAAVSIGTVPQPPLPHGLDEFFIRL